MRRWLAVLGALLALPVVLLSGINLFNSIRVGIAEFDKAADSLLERSRSLKGIASPDYQSRVLGSLLKSPFNGPVTRLDDRVEEAQILDEPASTDESDEGVLFSLEFNDESGFSGDESTREIGWQTKQNRLVILDEARTNTLHRLSTGEMPIDEVGEIVIRARSEAGGRMGLGWASQRRTEEPWRYELDLTLDPDGAFHDYTINARNILNRGIGRGEFIREIAVRLRSTQVSSVEIEHIRFLSKISRFAARRRGSDFETLGGEMRKVLFMSTPQGLEFPAAVPHGHPRFDVGLGALMPGEPVRFEVEISDASGSETLVDRWIVGDSVWQDVSLDLTPWAGKSVKIVLATASVERNVAFWSNPVLYPDRARPFNIILLLEDATRADHLSAYGYGLPTTPNKSRILGEKGVIFNHAFSQSTKTRSSIPTLMTSLLPSASGVWRTDDILRDEYVTLAEVLRHQGFRTAAFLQNGNAGPTVGLHQGFGSLFDRSVVGPSTEDILGDPLTEWLQRAPHRNFFLYLHVIDPHGRYDPPKPFDDWYRELDAKRSEVEPDDRFDAVWETRPTAEGRRALYDGEIRHNDAVIGDLFSHLEEVGLLQNTLVFMVADHGEYLGDSSNYHDKILVEPPRWNHTPPGLTPVIRVPMMVHFPSRFDEPRRIDEPVQLMDVMPTILDLAAIDPRSFLLQGDSLVDLIERGGSHWSDRLVISEEPEIMSKIDRSRSSGLSVNGSVLFRDWHFVTSNNFKRPWRLPSVLKMRTFNYRKDPGEESPLLTFVPDLVTRFRVADLLNELQASNMEVWRDWSMSDEVETRRIDPDVEERLRALGYVD